jgi:hypothetical protein
MLASGSPGAEADCQASAASALSMEGKIMEEVEDVLRTLLEPADRFRTVRATIRHSRDVHLENRSAGIGRPSLSRDNIESGGGSKSPRITTTVARIWLNRPGLARIEERCDLGGGIERNLTVFDGLRRWERHSDGRVETRQCEAQSEMTSAYTYLDTIIDRHFNPELLRQFLEVLTLEPMGCTRTADGECVSVRALPRPDNSPWPHWLPYRADEYELHVDLERGVLLNIIGRYRGELLGQHEVTEVAFDEPLDHSLFTYQPAPGDQVQPEAPLFEELRSREEAISRVPFQILFPTLMHEPEYRFSKITYHRPRRTGDQSNLSLSYYSMDGNFSVYVCENAEPDAEPDDYEWERLTHEGITQTELRISDSGEAEDERVVAFEQNGTHVTIISNLDRTKLLEIALSFKAATDDQTGWNGWIRDEDFSSADHDRTPF